MAAGEFVSVSSQRDAELADIAVEQRELVADPVAELEELTGIYVARGLDLALARQVAEQLSAKDGLGAHLRDELGIAHGVLARPLEAAWVSAVSFALFAMIPILALLVAPAAWRVQVIAGATIASLAALGALGGKLAGAPLGRATLRVTLGGALAMAVTIGVGRVLGVAVG